MAIKCNIVIRFCTRHVIGVMLMGASTLLLSGCLSLFDSPPGREEVDPAEKLQTMSRVLSATSEDVMNAGRSKADGIKKRSGDGTEEEESGEWEMPRLSFERFNADMPHLAMWGLDEATLLLDGEQIEPGKMTRAGRIALIGTGRHMLQVRCPFDPPFSADFYLAKNDRVVLRGRCSSGKRTMKR